MSKNKPTNKIEAQGDLHFAIVASRYNERHVEHLLERVKTQLRNKGIPANAITVTRVPGANEIPYVTSLLSLTGDYDCIIALGVIIAGETPHHEIIANSTANAFHKIGIDSQIPVINGVIVTMNEAQADERVFGKTDRGTEFANAAIEMAILGNKLADYLEELDKNDLERERREEILGNMSIDDNNGGDDDDDGDNNDFFGDSRKPFHRN
ncbi:MAG: 6,7-dimethyl-8-ribityllumazine synthase [Opitutae bacterium]|nr:6,7-dimethyl-8-ribityllumazine synthase [Opitutae bacterium]